jgi:glycosyltransferase involved in cell wall biosynthesis
MKIALISMDLGVPRTLASTAFKRAFADGLTHLAIPVKVIGLLGWEEGWHPEALAPVETAAPWLSPAPPRLQDAIDAVARGILDDDSFRGDHFTGTQPNWYLEMLAERALEEFAGGDPLVLLVYPIYYPVLRVATRIAKRRGWKLVVQSCEAMSGSWIDPATRDDYIRMVSSDADGVWALSDYLAQYWAAQGVPPEHILVQPNIVRRDAFGSTHAPRAQSAVYVGNLQHQEIEHLLDIANLVRRRIPEFRLCVYGDAREDRRAEITRAISGRGLTQTVTLHPPIPPAEIPEALGVADVLLLPRALGEFSTAGFPNKLGEYLASGRPVVVTRVGDIPKYLVDGQSALLAEPDDCDAFAEAVVRVLTHPEDADAIGAAGQRVAEELLASPRAAKRVVDFIASLPTPSRSHAGARVWFSRVRTWIEAIATVFVAGVRRGLALTWRSVRYARNGHTRWMAFKIFAVNVLRALGLRPPAP